MKPCKEEGGGGGHWYVRNVAKANTKAPPPTHTHTLLSLMKSMQPTFPVQRPHQTEALAQRNGADPGGGSSRSISRAELELNRSVLGSAPASGSSQASCV